MSSTILAGLFSSPIVKIKNETTGRIVCKSLKVVSAKVRMPSKIFRHKMENGSTVVDGRVFEPFEISIVAYAQDFDTLDQVNKMLLDRKSYYTVSIRDVLWTNVIGDNEAVEQSAEVVNASPITLRFKEVLRTAIVEKKVEQPADSPNRERGDTIPTDTTTTVDQASTAEMKRE